MDFFWKREELCSKGKHGKAKHIVRQLEPLLAQIAAGGPSAATILIIFDGFGPLYFERDVRAHLEPEVP